MTRRIFHDCRAAYGVRLGYIDMRGKTYEDAQNAASLATGAVSKGSLYIESAIYGFVALAQQSGHRTNIVSRILDLKNTWDAVILLT